MVSTYNAENSLKSICLSVITDLLNTQTNSFFAMIEQNSNNLWGKDIRYTKEYNGKHYQFISELKNLYLQVEIPEKAMRAFNINGVSAFMNLVNNEFEKLLSTVRNDLSRMLFSQERDKKDLTGIADVFDISKPLYGIDRNETPLLMPIIKEIAELNDVVIEQAIDEVELNGGKVDFIAVSSDMKYAYIEQHKNIDVIQINNGFRAFSHNGIPLVYDKSIPQGTMYLLDTSKFKLHQLCDWEWLEDDNGHILRKIPDKDSYTATLVKYCDLICEAPNCQAMIKLCKD